MRILVVRLSALGDVVHALPAVAALRRASPAARIDWLVDERYRELVDLVPVVDHRITLPRVRRVSGAPRVVRALRATRYDVALDLQGLLKSGLLARWSGARRVIGFDRAHRRERAAGWLYTETPPLGEPVHVIERNLALAACLDAPPRPFEFPLAGRPSGAVDRTRAALGIDRGRPFVLVSPGAAWRSKRWPPERFGALAQRLRAARGLRSAVLWGPGERALAEQCGDRLGGRCRAGARHVGGRPGRAGARGRPHGGGRHRSAARRRGGRRPRGRDLRAERPAAERTLVAARRSSSPAATSAAAGRTGPERLAWSSAAARRRSPASRPSRWMKWRRRRRADSPPRTNPRLQCPLDSAAGRV